jgi:hypothetical protein
MVYGRPMGIPPLQMDNQELSLPLDIDDQYIATGQSQPKEVPAMNTFFRSTIQLYIVMEGILQEFTSLSCPRPNINSATGELLDPCSTGGVSTLALLTAIIDLDERLMLWHRSLPDFLRFPLDLVEMTPDYPFWLQRQRAILQHRFLGMRVLLHRQTILYLLRSHKDRVWLCGASYRWPASFSDIGRDMAFVSHAFTRLEERPHLVAERSLAQEGAKICIKSALLLVEAILYHSPRRLTSTWWWNLHCMLKAKITLYMNGTNGYLVTFNSLCVLCGGTGLNMTDRSVILTDSSRVLNTIQAGLELINSLVPHAGHPAAQSQKFLKHLFDVCMYGRKQVCDRLTTHLYYHTMIKLHLHTYRGTIIATRNHLKTVRQPT